MTDARFSGGSVASSLATSGLNGPIALVEDSVEIVADLDTNEFEFTALSRSRDRQAARDGVGQGGVANCGVQACRSIAPQSRKYGFETGSLRSHFGCYYRTDDFSQTEIWPAMIAAVTDISGHLDGAHRA